MIQSDIIRYIMLPVVGAVIGYATNWIAVKMLFRPRHEVRVFGWKLPFTPGVIPKGQARLAAATGKAVEEQLLTREVLSRVLLSEEMKEKVASTVADWVADQEESQMTVEEVICESMPEEELVRLTETLQSRLTDVVYNKLLEKNVGRIVADTALDAAREKLAESVLGMMVSGSMLDPIGEKMESKINEYVKENAWTHIRDMIGEGISSIEGKTVGEIALQIKEYNMDFPALVLTLYERLVNEKLPAVLKALNLTGIVEDRINAMKVEEVEELLLSIMKKELGAIVNLGALIGFVLGLCNLAILLF